MSSIMLERAHFVLLGCALETRLPRDERTLADRIGSDHYQPIDIDDERCLSERIICRWYQANVDAYGARYEGRHGAPMPFDPAIYREMRPRMELETHKGRVLVFKSLECLRYQCADDVAGSDHARIMESLRHAIEVQAGAVISSLPEYESAPWCVGEWK